MHVAPEPPDFQELQQWPAVGAIETDRFCDLCGYNLRTQPVRREPRTGVFVCRCPECSRFHAAADATSITRPILRRALSFLLLLWVLVLLGAFITSAVLDYCVIEECFRHLTQYVHAGSPGIRLKDLPLGRQYGFVPRPLPALERNIALAVFGAFSLGIGLGTGLLIAIMLHHLKPFGRLLLIVLVPAIPAASAAVWIWSDASNILQFGITLVAAHALLQVLGAVMGVAIGRPLARLLARAFVPAGWRGPLAFLWLVDGKPLPARAQEVKAERPQLAGSVP